jgi:hypothetical protein
MADFFRAEEIRSLFTINNAMTRVLTTAEEYRSYIHDEPDLELGLKELKTTA